MNIEIIMLFLLVIVLLIFLLPRTEEDGKERAGKEGEILAGKMIPTISQWTRYSL